jgi:hypothetical protein
MRRQAISSMQTPDFSARQTTSLYLISMGCPLPLTGALTLRDVKNEDRPGYVYENTGNIDKLSTPKTGFLQKNAPIARYLTTIGQVYCGNYQGWEQESTMGEAVLNSGLPHSKL